jgi:hypothetical protein
MLNKETCQTLLPLVNNPAAWDSLETYLKDLKERSQALLVVEKSDSEMRLLQGKVQVVDHLLSLKTQVNTQQKEYNKRGN